MNYIPELQYLPDNLEIINSKTPLAKNVSLGAFLNGVTLEHLSIPERQQIVRNLLPQAQIYKAIRENRTILSGFKLKIVEGIYKKKPDQQLTENGPLDLASQGRRVVYELVGQCGTSSDKTIEAITYLSIFKRNYDKLILDYDTYNPDGTLNVQIIVETPEIPDTYKVSFKLETETLFNNNTYGSDFVKIKGKERANPFISDLDIAVDGEVINDGDGGKVTYVNQNAKRKLKLVPKLENIIIAAAEATGYDVKIFSGGQDGSTEHVGSNRHNNGYAADIWIYKNGRQISMVQNADLAANFAKAAKQAGALSIGAGSGYMDGVGMHVDISPGNTVPITEARYWGKDGASRNAPKWLVSIMT